MTSWLRQTELLLECGQFSELEFIARLDLAGSFLFELSNTLDCHLRRRYASRSDVLAAHGEIMCSWLEASPIEHVAEISEQWHRSFIENHNQQCDAAIAAANDMSADQQNNGGELAWRLMQTHRLGKEFRQAYAQHISGQPSRPNC
ncbi:hypothetical protein ACO0K7_17055 [Undibacterium sp. Ji67W]|uniref:hypothetical protein n=1 Tax=Undibacterium sp. Ji67W TaxID=3413042 RepID=UPI003BF2986C